MRKVIEPKFHIRQTGGMDYVRRMAAGECWSLSRFNDGEWFAILGRDDPKYHTYNNCDGHEYSPALCDALAECLLDVSGYTYGIGGMKHHDAQAAWLESHGVEIEWHYSDSIKMMNNAGTLAPFLEELRQHSVLIVGPAHLSRLGKMLRLPNYGFLGIPLKNCYLKTEDVATWVSVQIDHRGRDVVLFSASMATNVWIHRLWPEYGDRVWMIDCGAMWDIYAGVESRGVFRNQDWAPIIAKNLA